MPLCNLMISTDGLSLPQIEALGRDTYKALYVPNSFRNEIVTNDGINVVFFYDRYEHAFKTSSDRARRPDAKDVVAVERIQRIRWINEIINKQVPNTRCILVPSPTGRRWPPNRLYIVRNYVVWLEPLRDGKWKFSTAYTARPEDVRRYSKTQIKWEWST